MRSLSIWASENWFFVIQCTRDRYALGYHRNISHSMHIHKLTHKMFSFLFFFVSDGIPSDSKEYGCILIVQFSDSMRKEIILWIVIILWHSDPHSKKIENFHAPDLVWEFCLFFFCNTAHFMNKYCRYLRSKLLYQLQTAQLRNVQWRTSLKVCICECAVQLIDNKLFSTRKPELSFRQQKTTNNEIAFLPNLNGYFLLLCKPDSSLCYGMKLRHNLNNTFFFKKKRKKT